MPQPPNMQQMLKQVQKMQADMMAAQEKLKDERVEATAGGGMVKVVVSRRPRGQGDHDQPRGHRPGGPRAAPGPDPRRRQRGAALGPGDGRDPAGRPRRRDGRPRAAGALGVRRRPSSGSSPSSAGCPGSARAPRSGWPSTSCAPHRRRRSRSPTRSARSRSASGCASAASTSPRSACARSAATRAATPRVVCVVEEPGDVIPIERTHEFRGVYHVLGGALSPDRRGRSRGPAHRAAAARAWAEEGVTEVVVATNPTTTGEATALYIADALRARSPESRSRGWPRDFRSAPTSSTPTRSRSARRWPAGARSDAHLYPAPAMRRLLPLLAVLTALSALAQGCGGGSSKKDDVASGPVFLGVSVNPQLLSYPKLAESEFPLMVRSGVTTIRVVFPWSALEPVKGQPGLRLHRSAGDARGAKRPRRAAGRRRLALVGQEEPLRSGRAAQGPGRLRALPDRR